jgi:hypothetical protein
MQRKRINSSCEIEYAASWSDQGLPCGKPAVAECADCGKAICEECQMECCGNSYCVACYEYHDAHSCLRKPVQGERRIHERTETA